MTDITLFGGGPLEPLHRGEVAYVDFDGGRVAVVVVEDEPYPILRHAAVELGLNWSGQEQKVKADPAICVWETYTRLPGDDQARVVLASDLDGFVLWLAKINANKVAPDARDTVIAWQRRAARAIRERFFGPAKPTVDLSDPLAALQVVSEQLGKAVNVALAERAAREAAESKAAELEELADGYRHFIEDDGTETVKWHNACDHLGVGPDLFGAYLRDKRVLYTGGERHNRPYSGFTHWFQFPARVEEYPGQLDRIPAHRRFDRRVTKAGMDGLLRLLKRHVVECGTCSMCQGFAKNRPERYAAWRPARLLGGAA